MIVVDSEFQSLIPPLSDEETQRLEKSLVTNGWQEWREPIITWNGTIIDGHNRYRICEKHGIEFKTMEMQFDSRDAAKIWIIENQFTRRNLSRYDRGVLALQLEEMYAAEAKKRQGTRTDIPQKSAESFKGGETRDKVAAIAGISHDTLRKVKVIETEAQGGNPTAIEAREAVKSGKKSIHKAYTEVRANGDKTDTRPLCTVCGKPVDDDDHYPRDVNKHKKCANQVENENKRKARKKPKFTDDGRRICSICGNPIDEGDSYDCDLSTHKKCYQARNREDQYQNPDKVLLGNVATYTIESLVMELTSSAESMRESMEQSIAINNSMGVHLNRRKRRALDRAIDHVFKAIKTIGEE